MTTRIELKRARARTAEIFRAKPKVAQGTGIARTRLTDGGCHCEVTEGGFSFEVDMPSAVGGSERAPGPGAHLRGALGSCLAIGIAGLAADRGIEIEGLSVEVQTDSDTRGWLITDSGVSPGYSQIRITAEIDSPATAAELEALVNDSIKHSRVADALTCANDVVTDVVVKRVAAE